MLIFFKNNEYNCLIHSHPYKRNHASKNVKPYNSLNAYVCTIICNFFYINLFILLLVFKIY